MQFKITPKLGIGESVNQHSEAITIMLCCPGPLSALHTMTDMKAAAMLSQAQAATRAAVSPGPAPECEGGSPSPPPASSQVAATAPGQHAVNPHGIDSILNRRQQQGAAGLPGLGLATSTATSMGENLSTTMSRSVAIHSGEIVSTEKAG